MYDSPVQCAPLNYKFTGKERDAESGLDNFGARYDASSMGRFMTPDPVPWAHWQDGSKKDRQRFAAYISNPQNFNMYAYVRNNPLNSIDPTGELVYVVVYTTGNSKGDEQLKKAAETKANDIANSKTFDPKKDTVLLLGVKTKSDFQNLLNAANSLDSKFGQVQSVSLFSHAGDQSGPIFHDQNGKPSQFSSSELSGINVNWSNSATASFYGCNTGVNFTRDFANAQQVPAYGFMGGVDFSGSPDTKSKGYVLNPYNRDLYMIDVQEKGLQRQDPDE